jgi:hypothetical protein
VEAIRQHSKPIHEETARTQSLPPFSQPSPASVIGALNPDVNRIIMNRVKTRKWRNPEIREP